jgi:hypothetical protein
MQCNVVCLVVVLDSAALERGDSTLWVSESEKYNQPLLVDWIHLDSPAASFSVPVLINVQAAWGNTLRRNMRYTLTG